MTSNGSLGSSSTTDDHNLAVNSNVDYLNQKSKLELSVYNDVKKVYKLINEAKKQLPPKPKIEEKRYTLELLDKFINSINLINNLIEKSKDKNVEMLTNEINNILRNVNLGINIFDFKLKELLENSSTSSNHLISINLNQLDINNNLNLNKLNSQTNLISLESDDDENLTSNNEVNF